MISFFYSANKTRSALLVCILFCASLAGCMPVKLPQLPDQTARYWQTQTGNGTVHADLRTWWKVFNDSRLNGIVDTALSHNLTIQQATERLAGVRNTSSHLHDLYLPDVSANGVPVEDARARNSFYHVSLDVTWELGLFGSYQGQQMSAEADLRTAISERDSAMVSVIAGVVQAYLNLGVANQQSALLKQQLAYETQLIHLGQVRINSRVGSRDAVQQLEIQQLQTQAALASSQLEVSHAEHTLAALLGRDEPDPSWSTIQEPPVLPAGYTLDAVPADMLRTRPDILAAEANVMKAAAQLGIARAALYPQLNLGGSILYSYNLTDDRRSSSDMTPSIGPTINIPLWNWGARIDERNTRKRDLKAALLGYRQAVVAGESEVEKSLVSMRYAQQRSDDLSAIQKINDDRVSTTQKRIGLGYANQYDLVDAKIDTLRAKSARMLANSERTLAFIALYKALGGAPYNQLSLRDTP
ncbi:Outer membrane protein OprM [Halomonadaceae bacterium LMG 33818]|uniref:efflux transporter outer membrane subunit n=1 Tax=Cernens ardua TaxID=3402176 RepID=UPI003EDB7CC7